DVNFIYLFFGKWKGLYSMPSIAYHVLRNEGEAHNEGAERQRQGLGYRAGGDREVLEAHREEARGEAYQRTRPQVHPRGRREQARHAREAHHSDKVQEGARRIG